MMGVFIKFYLCEDLYLRFRYFEGFLTCSFLLRGLLPTYLTI